jgi:hypothetical protein
MVGSEPRPKTIEIIALVGYIRERRTHLQQEEDPLSMRFSRKIVARLITLAAAFAVIVSVATPAHASLDYSGDYNVIHMENGPTHMASLSTVTSPGHGRCRVFRGGRLNQVPRPERVNRLLTCRA